MTLHQSWSSRNILATTIMDVPKMAHQRYKPPTEESEISYYLFFSFSSRGGGDRGLMYDPYNVRLFHWESSLITPQRSSEVKQCKPQYVIKDVRRFHHLEKVTLLQWSPGGEALATVDETGKLVLWQQEENIQDWNKWWEVELGKKILCFLWLASEREVALNEDASWSLEKFLGPRNLSGRYGFMIVTDDAKAYIFLQTEEMHFEEIVEDFDIVDEINILQTAKIQLYDEYFLILYKKQGNNEILMKKATLNSSTNSLSITDLYTLELQLSPELLPNYEEPLVLEFTKSRFDTSSLVMAGIKSKGPDTYALLWQLNISPKGKLGVVKAENPQVMITFKNKTLTCLTFSNQELKSFPLYCAFGFSDGSLELRSLTDNVEEVLHSFRLTSSNIPIDLAFSPSNSVISIYTQTDQLYFWNLYDIIYFNSESKEALAKFLAEVSIYKLLNHYDVAEAVGLIMSCITKYPELEMAILEQVDKGLNSYKRSNGIQLFCRYKVSIFRYSHNRQVQYGCAYLLLQVFSLVDSLDAISLHSESDNENWEGTSLYSGINYKGEKDVVYLLSYVRDIFIELYRELYVFLFTLRGKGNSIKVEPTIISILLNPSTFVMLQKLMNKVNELAANSRLTRKYPGISENLINSSPVPLRNFHHLMNEIAPLIEKVEIPEMDLIRLRVYDQVPKVMHADILPKLKLLSLNGFEISEVFTYNTSRLGIKRQPVAEKEITFDESREWRQLRYQSAAYEPDVVARMPLLRTGTELRQCSRCHRYSGKLDAVWTQQHSHFSCICGGLWRGLRLPSINY